MRTDHVNSSATSPHHLYFFPDFFLVFFIWNYKIYHIWQFLVFIPVTGFQCHSVPVNSGDCSGEITGISKFRGRSEILAGKFHWNGTGIRRNDRNPAGICRASLRPHLVCHSYWSRTQHMQLSMHESCKFHSWQHWRIVDRHIDFAQSLSNLQYEDILFSENLNCPCSFHGKESNEFCNWCNVH